MKSRSAGHVGAIGAVAATLLAAGCAVQQTPQVLSGPAWQLPANADPAQSGNHKRFVWHAARPGIWVRGESVERQCGADCTPNDPIRATLHAAVGAASYSPYEADGRTKRRTRAVLGRLSQTGRGEDARFRTRAGYRREFYFVLDTLHDNGQLPWTIYSVDSLPYGSFRVRPVTNGYLRRCHQRGTPAHPPKPFPAAFSDCDMPAPSGRGPAASEAPLHALLNGEGAWFECDFGCCTTSSAAVAF